MIITKEPDDKKKLASRYTDNAEPVASSSATESDHLLADLASAEAPPDFAPYDAEHFQVGYEDVVSHDPHINSDGEALYRFLLAQSASRPTIRLHCSGTHTEYRTRWVTHRDSQGRSHSRQERYQETVTDFDFCIDITPGEVEVETGPNNDNSRGRTVQPIHWSVPDDEPAYRGKMVREYEVEPYAATERPSTSRSRDEWSDQGRRSAHRKEAKAFKKWVEKRDAAGFPPWVRQADVENGIVLDPAAVSVLESQVLRSSKSLRQWADEYCASPKYLKEFVYHKVPYGWNMDQIQSAVRATILSTPYNGSLTITFVPHNTKIYIRPDNRVARMLSNKWLKVLSIVFLIFPFIWLFKRFHSRGGGRWEVCGGAYPLKQWVPVQGEEALAAAEAELSAQGDELPPYVDEMAVYSAVRPSPVPTGPGAQRSRSYVQTPTGPKKLIGVKEGEWFKSWEGVIARAVIGRYQSNIPLPRTTRSHREARTLDGYDDAHPSPLVEY